MGQSFESLSQLPRPLGQFTLIRLIAQGGMGSVFLALRPDENEPTDEVCVVKTVRTDLKDDREAIGRFLDEARVVQKLDHPAICHTLDAGVVEKSYYLALEFISGRNIRDVTTRAAKLNKKVPDHVIFHALSEVLGALEYAHMLDDPETGEPLGIVHRDVSPHNVMIGFDGYVKLIDFGLAAHVLKKELTRPGIMVGKLRYNAPEQVRDRALDGRSDLYSVGVMMYELVVGERFYEGLSEEDIWRVAMKGTHRPRLYDRVPADLRNILDLALPNNPEERFASAADMQDALLEVAQSRGVREPRRASAAFMSELFSQERQEEREMILQATGLAEARTRLFQAPQSVDSIDEPSVSVSSVGRTKVVSPAQVRGKLADLVSGFDPNAETQLPNAPIEDMIGRLEAERAARDPNVFAEVDDTLPATNVGNFAKARRSTNSGQPALKKPIIDENLRSSRNATAEAPATRRDLPRASKSKENKREVATSPVRKRPPSKAAQPQGPSPALLIGGLVAAGVVLIIAAVIALPRLFDDKPVKHHVTEPDENRGTIEKPPPDRNVDPPDHVDEKPPEHVDEKPPDHVETKPPDHVDAKPPDHIVDEKPPPPKKIPKKEPKEKEGAPPPFTGKIMKEQVEYLKTWCMERVACAKTSTESAAQLAQLTPDEFKALQQELPKCIARCQK